MKTSSDKPEISRRDFGKLAAGMGLASLSGFAPSIIQAEENSQKLRENYRVKNGKSPIVIDESMIKPYSRERVGFRSVNFPNKKTGKLEPWYKPYYKKAIGNALTGYHHPEIKAESIADSRASFALSESMNFLEFRGQNSGDSLPNYCQVLSFNLKLSTCKHFNLTCKLNKLFCQINSQMEF